MKKCGLLLILLLFGCATADRAQVADLTTTAIALNMGFEEGNPFLNPVGMPGMVAIKLGVTQVVKFLPEPICTPGLFGLTVTGYGAAIWNVGVIMGSGPIALPLVVALTWWQWNPWLDSAANSCADPWHIEIEQISRWNEEPQS